jgi:hypothetical protein
MLRAGRSFLLADRTSCLGTADAVVIAIAERFRAVNIATLDRRQSLGRTLA